MAPRLGRMRLIIFFGFIAAMMARFGVDNPVIADGNRSTCPWIVQPDEVESGQGTGIEHYEILFTGRITDAIFYGFTVTDDHVARQLNIDATIPDLTRNGRALEAVERDGTIVYRLSADTILPRTIYLLTAGRSMKRLEMIDARIDPARPIAIGMHTRGASDFTGPLPHRTAPAREVLTIPHSDDPSIVLSSLDQDFQLCAFQVSWN